MPIIIEDNDYIEINLDHSEFIRDNLNDLMRILDTLTKNNNKVLVYSNDRGNLLQREGSIGEITNFYIPWNIKMVMQHYSKFVNPEYKYLIPKDKYSAYYLNMCQYYRCDMLESSYASLKFDNKHSPYTLSLKDVKIIKDENVESKYVFTKSPVRKVKKEDIKLKDKFDNEFGVGSFICFAKSTSRQQGIPCFGKVTKINNSKHFIAESLKLSENDYKRTVTLRNPEDVILMTDDLMDQIMVARLTY